MGKPLGINFGSDPHRPALGVSHPSRTEDAIWDAVEEAVNAGWTPRVDRALRMEIPRIVGQ